MELCAHLLKLNNNTCLSIHHSLQNALTLTLQIYVVTRNVHLQLTSTHEYPKKCMHRFENPTLISCSHVAHNQWRKT